jgi:hypothetical protein
MSLDNTTGASQDSPPAQDVNVDSSTTEEQQHVPKARLDQVISQRNQKNLELQALRNELEIERSRQPQPQSQIQTQPLETISKSIEDFDYDDTAFQAYQRDQKALENENLRASLLVDIRKDLQTEQEQQTFTNNLTAYTQKTATYEASNPSFTDAQNNMLAQEMQFSPLVAEIVLKNDDPAVQHALMNDLQALYNLNQLDDPTRIALAIGKIGTNLQKPVSSAPDPSPSIGDGSSTSVGADISKMSMEDYARHRRSGN